MPLGIMDVGLGPGHIVLGGDPAPPPKKGNSPRILAPSANFNGFHVLPSLLQGRRSREANQTLYDVRPSPGLVHYMLCPPKHV